jgi:hypothetical protein
MRLRKPGSKPFGRPVSARLTGLAGTARGVGRELLAIGREMLRIPAGLYMRAAEAAGAATLAAWRVAWPLLQALWRRLLAGFRLAEREVTPIRAALAVAAVAAIALAGSQFADYRSIAIGTDDYIGVETVAPAPEVDEARASAGSAHAWLGLPLAVGALVAVLACARGNRKAAWWLAPIGLIVIAVSLIVDVPKGLDEGDAAVAYQGAEASLLGGFWVQLACGVLLVALAPIISGLLRSKAGGAPANGDRRRMPWARVPAGEAGG